MLEYLIKDEIINKEDRIAVGVSGGADSMLLLWAILDKQKQLGFYFKVININHHIRGDESDRDSDFVRDFCEKKNIPYEIVDVNAAEHSKTNKIGLEEAARKLRYDAFYKVMKRDKLNKLFLAHHKNDQAETVLMHIFRGSGISGACGIKDNGIIFRPLVHLSKSQIIKLCNEHGVKFVEDSTNSDTAYSRNYIRNVVIKDIEKVYPAAVDAICMFADRCKEVQEFIESSLDCNLLETGKGYVTIKDAAFNNPSFIVREYLNKAFLSINIFSDIELKHYEMIYKLEKAEVNTKINLPHKLIAKRTYGGVKILKESENSKIAREYEFVIGKLEIDGYGIIETTLVPFEGVVYGDGSLYADLAKISNKAVWRFRKLGDTFSKLGTGSKKLNDYFTDKKIDSDIRDKVPVLATGNQVLVVSSLDVSENAKIDGNTDQIVRIKFIPNADC